MFPKRIIGFVYSIIFFFAVSPSIFAQEKSERFYSNYRLNIKGAATVPHLLTSKGLRKSFVGTYGFNTSVNLDLYKGICVGLNYEIGAYTASAKKIAKLSFHEPTMHNNNFGVVLGYDYYSSEIVMWSLSAEAGTTKVDFRNLSCTPADTLVNIHSFSTFYIKPEASVVFFVEQNFAIGFTVSYHLLDQVFHPDMACLSTYNQYSPDELSGSISYLNFGFSVYVGLWKKKK